MYQIENQTPKGAIETMLTGKIMNITVTNDHDEEGFQVAYVTCPDCGSVQPCVITQVDGDKKRFSTAVTLPAVCEHMEHAAD